MNALKHHLVLCVCLDVSSCVIYVGDDSDSSGRSGPLCVSRLLYLRSFLLCVFESPELLV